MSKQILRSGTSIGANVAEAIYAQSRADFFAKIGIAKKEAAKNCPLDQRCRFSYHIKLLTGFSNFWSTTLLIMGLIGCNRRKIS